jgi:argininosuccinate lyase
MAYFWMLARDRERLADCRRRTDVSPLGSGALAGHPFGIDRSALAAELGFASYSHNSLDGVSDRDFAAEALFALALIGVHLSRLGEDIILYSNPALGFINLDDRYSTGSSIMPQKRNADPLELARGKAGRLIGHLAGLLTTLKGLPMTYNKDLQEDKEPVFDAFDQLETLLPVVTAILVSLKVNHEHMQAALSEELLATDLAEYLVRKGMPFRQAHHIVGRAVRMAADTGLRLSALPLADMQALSPLFDADAADVFSFRRSVAARDTAGGTAPEAVKAQIAVAQRWMDAR